MELPENCLRIRIYIGEADLWEHQSLHEALVLKARELGLAGATVFRSPMGYGLTSRIHTSKILNLSTDLPIVIEIIEEQSKIDAFLTAIQPMLSGGLITTEPVRVIHYHSHTDR